jgi:hypothetical protein
MKAIVIAALLLLVPVAVLAQPTMGLYFTYTPGNIYYYITDPPPQFFDGYIYAHNVDCYLSACEFQLVIGHPAITVQTTDYLPGSVTLGDPVNGVSITYWPPLDGWTPGYNLLCTVHFLATDYCLHCGGTLIDVPIVIGPHPDTGEIRGTCWPDNDIFQFIGLSAMICPCGTDTQEESWGAIKKMIE